MDTPATTIVLGAGPAGIGSGLGVQLHAPQQKLILVEKLPHPGGISGSFDWRGHLVDYGAHRLSHNVPDLVLLAKEIVGDNLMEPHNEQGIFLANRVVHFPPRIRDWCAPSLLAMMCGFAGSFLWTKCSSLFSTSADPTFPVMIQHMFGKNVANNMILPLAEKVWGNPDVISTDFARQRFTVVSPRQIIQRVFNRKKDMTPPSFFYPRKGFRQLWESMTDWLSERDASVRMSCQPEKIVVKNNRIQRMDLSDGTTLEGDNLQVVSTIPMSNLFDILEGFSIDETVREALEALRYRSLLVAAFEFERETTLPVRVITFPHKKQFFTRIFEQNGFARDSVQAGKSVVVVEMTVTRGGETFALTDEEILDRIESDLRALPFMDMSALSARTLQRKEYAYMVPDVQTRQAMATLCERLGQISNLHLTGRFGDGEYDNCDYACEKGILLGSMLAGTLPEEEYKFQIQSMRGRVITG